MATHKPDIGKLCISQLQKITGKSYRTVKSRLNEIDPISRDGKTLFFETKKALSLIYESKDAYAEKARLDRLRADEIEHRLQLAKNEVAPIAILEDALLRISEQICSILDSLPLRIKKRVPKLTAREIENIRREIVKAQNAASQAKLE